jgi:hypothetical protein
MDSTFSFRKGCLDFVLKMMAHLIQIFLSTLSSSSP